MSTTNRNADSRLRSHRRSVLRPQWASGGYIRQNPGDRFAAPIARPLPDRSTRQPVFMCRLPSVPSAALLPQTWTVTTLVAEATKD
jgi:hypothetical protein